MYKKRRKVSKSDKAKSLNDTNTSTTKHDKIVRDV